MICVSIGRSRQKMMLAEHRALAERGAKLVEFRLDWLKSPPDVAALLKDRPTPCVMTLRRGADRGRWTGTEERRLALLREAIVAGTDYVDLELDVAKSIPRYGKTKRIVSYHNFEETPDDLAAIHKKLAACDPDIVKLVTTANWPGDNARVLDLVKNAKVPTVGFCMGEVGTVSRILCGKYGSPFTYATFSRERELAPGQLSYDAMTKLYRYDAIGPATQVYAVAGDPIAHSYSPRIHNAALRAIKKDAVYVPLRVPRHTLPDTVKRLTALDVRGYSVTIPHKEAALELAEDRDPLAVAVGAANTLSLGKEGRWLAENTDYAAALSTLMEGLRRRKQDATLDGKRVLMLGAGGVARAIGAACVREGAVVTITSRTKSRSEELARELGAASVRWEQRGAGHLDVVVNCTPVGMHPDMDATPLPENFLQEHMLVFDTIYNPENTLLLKQARLRRCETVSGLEMFVRQAAAQFERFTGEAAPLDVMRESLRRGISAAH